MKNAGMKTKVSQIVLHRWPYGLELQPSPDGLLLRPRLKARAGWLKAFRLPRPNLDDLAATRQLANDFDAKEWKW